MTGGAKNLKPNSYRLIWRERNEALMCGPASYLPFRITGQRVPINGEVKWIIHVAIGKPNVRSHFVWSGTRCARLESLVGYPKPVELCVGRLKPGENWVEDRTSTDVQIVWMTCV